MVQIIKDEDEFKTFLKTAGCKLVVVEFSAKWCGPCKRIYPLVHALKENGMEVSWLNLYSRKKKNSRYFRHSKTAMSLQYQNVMFANVDIDDSRELAQTCRIRVVPTFQMFKQAQKIFEFCGADAKKLEGKIQELM